MARAYSSGVGQAGLTVGPAGVPTISESTLRDFPMTFEPLVHMPDPNDMSSPAMMRAHVYLTLCQMNTAHLNHFVFNNNQCVTLTPQRFHSVIALHSVVQRC